MVEMMSAEGTKLKGVLKEADEKGIVISLEKKITPEGAKRPKKMIVDESYSFEQIKYTKYLISFK